MGLFDRFRKRVIETEENQELTAEEDSPEAEEAMAKREELAQAATSREGVSQPAPQATEDQWDEPMDDVADPFAAPMTAKERKIADRRRAAKSPEETTPRVRDRFESTTGRELVSTTKPAFTIDLGEDSKSRGGRVIKGGKALEEILEELEIELMSADMGHAAVTELTSTIRMQLVGARIQRKASIEEVLERAIKRAITSLLEAGYWDFDATVKAQAAKGTPVVIMMVGVNGTGKTTTSAKIAKRLKDQGYQVVLAAADTFRAGAIDQLTAHADRLGVRCIRSERGGDSAAISRDAIDSATAKGEDVVIIDTAGRMQNKSNLMEELRKVHRVTKPHLVIFVADALAGNDAVTQATEFQRMLSFDGAALCKLDTDARGGAALSIAHATGRPIVLAGVGQGYDDLTPFDPERLLDDILFQ
ncbi:MAG TPA: signal recognition particle-docking protein FtsY [Candidatus Latescibacteria bacterium]|nr:signal recognition particle-docking protein FtsY [Candidatus Latescibacterota bacterium]